MTATVGPLLFTHTGTVKYQWEITDDSYTRTELIIQARPTFNAYLAEHHVTLVGPESWNVVPGRQQHLVVTAPAMWNGEQR